MRFLRCAFAVCGKDLLAELRQREITSTLLFFGLIVVFLFSFAMGEDVNRLKDLAPGILWVTVLLSAVVALERAFQTESEEGCLDRLILYTVSHRAVFLGKCLTNFGFILLVQIVVVFAMKVLFGLSDPQRPLFLFGTMLLGDVGIATLGTLYSAVLTKTRARHVMLPLLLFPMLIPLLLGAVYATEYALVGAVFGEARLWVNLLCVFDVIFVAASFIAIDPLMEA